ncbi:MAG: hypothetical protein JWP34_5099 [Massilia sp.]|jgi:hypothetical protein|nr:hypothetical protein [Massilia sp.]
MSDRIRAVAGLHAVYLLLWAGLLLVAVGRGPAFVAGLSCWLLAAFITASMVSAGLGCAISWAWRALR